MLCSNGDGEEAGASTSRAGEGITTAAVNCWFSKLAESAGVTGTLQLTYSQIQSKIDMVEHYTADGWLARAGVSQHGNVPFATRRAGSAAAV